MAVPQSEFTSDIKRAPLAVANKNTFTGGPEEHFTIDTLSIWTMSVLSATTASHFVKFIMSNCCPLTSPGFLTGKVWSVFS